MMPASTPPVVTVQNLSKKFCARLRTSLWYGLRDIAAELWPGERSHSGLRRAEFWSLKDVSFELRRGEALAIIGDNGAGKSTLLKLLNGLIKPDAGTIHIRGRVGALIELGAGLDPVLSGRENIFVRAALLGYARTEILPLLPAIIEFTGLGTAIEMPVQFYSSGMVSRLAYAVAAHLHPDVLLVDEVLAVGDFDFQRKCIRHMLGYLANGGSLILVSHQPHHIQSVCQRGLVLSRGKRTFAGTATEALDYYYAQQQQTAAPVVVPNPGPLALSPDRPVVIERLVVNGNNGAAIGPGDDLTLTLAYQALGPVAAVGWAFYIYTNDGSICITSAARPAPATLLAGHHMLSCRLPRLPLTAGDYLVKATIFDFAARQPLTQWGWEGTPTRLRVEAASSRTKNTQKMLQQLVTVDVEWNS